MSTTGEARHAPKKHEPAVPCHELCCVQAVVHSWGFLHGTPRWPKPPSRCDVRPTHGPHTATDLQGLNQMSCLSRGPGWLGCLLGGVPGYCSTQRALPASIDLRAFTCDVPRVCYPTQTPGPRPSAPAAHSEAGRFVGHVTVGIPQIKAGVSLKSQKVK